MSFFCFVFFALIFVSCSPPLLNERVFQPRSIYGVYSEQAVEYFQEIGFEEEEEFATRTSTSGIKKWTQGIRLGIYGAFTPEDRAEVENIMQELSHLTGLSFEWDSKNPNIKIHFLDQDRFRSLVPQYKPSNPQDGLFELKYDKQTHEVQSATILIRRDIQGRHRLHILREELTQCMGLRKDSYTYKDSIFQQDPEFMPVQYSLLDKEVIQILYDRRVRPGMSTHQALRALKT